MEDDFSRWFLSWFPYIKRGDVPLFPGDSQGPTAGMTSGVPPWGSDITARDGHPIALEYPYQHLSTIGILWIFIPYSSLESEF